MKRLRVKVVSPWFGQLDTADAIFRADFRIDEADALLCEWAPAPELFQFPRRKAWYCCEPWPHFSELGGGEWPLQRDRLDESEFLYHNHFLPDFRVPHITHFESHDIDRSKNRVDRAVAVVSNHGGNPWRRHSMVSYRNRFVTSPSVDLFGREGWKDYRRGRFSRRRAPSNYQGAIPGDWPATEKRAVLARYKVAVCLENVIEPRYFTEKFVEAVRAGCIPVYRPDAESRKGILAGAFWVDPEEFDDDPETTIAFALSQDLESVQEQNLDWLLTSKALASTSHSEVFQQIGRILSR